MRSDTFALRARKKARAHPVGDFAEPQIEARGLDLILGEGALDADRALLRQIRDHAVGQGCPLRLVWRDATIAPLC